MEVEAMSEQGEKAEGAASVGSLDREALVERALAWWDCDPRDYPHSGRTMREVLADFALSVLRERAPAPSEAEVRADERRKADERWERRVLDLATEIENSAGVNSLPFAEMVRSLAAHPQAGGQEQEKPGDPTADEALAPERRASTSEGSARTTSAGAEAVGSERLTRDPPAPSSDARAALVELARKMWTDSDWAKTGKIRSLPEWMADFALAERSELERENAELRTRLNRWHILFGISAESAGDAFRRAVTERDEARAALAARTGDAENFEKAAREQDLRVARGILRNLADYEGRPELLVILQHHARAYFDDVKKMETEIKLRAQPAPAPDTRAARMGADLFPYQKPAPATTEEPILPPGDWTPEKVRAFNSSPPAAPVSAEAKDVFEAVAAESYGCQPHQRMRGKLDLAALLRARFGDVVDFVEGQESAGSMAAQIALRSLRTPAAGREEGS